MNRSTPSGLPRALSPAELCGGCDPSRFQFETTDELEDLTEFIGQARAAGAVRFGIGMRREGYNLYVLGPPGAGKRTLVQEFLARRAKDEGRPSDWCYVHNFEQPHKPRALRLPPGRGVRLRNDMRQLVEELHVAIPAAFESEEYRTRAQQIEAEYAEREATALEKLGEEAAREGVVLLRTPAGFSFAPTKGGEVIAPEEYERLPAEEKKRIEEVVGRLHEKLATIVHQSRQWHKERRERIRQLNSEVAMFAVGHLTQELKERYHDLPEVQDYIDAVQSNVVETMDEFRKPEERPSPTLGMPVVETPSLRRFEVNVLVDHSEQDGAPLVVEDHPTYQNLAGRVEHIAHMGALVTDFTLIKPGALHRANGGYLLLDAYKLLAQPFAWEGLKRALSTREIRIESLGQMYSLVSTVSLEPQPIPLDVKVALIGPRFLYYLLQAYDPDFGELFKVAADFEDDLPRTPENELLYARLVGTIARREQMLPFDRGAVARVIEHSARLAGDREKLSAHVQSLKDLLAEADFLAREVGCKAVSADDVRNALENQIKRVDRLKQRVYEEILRGVLLIDTSGARIGQVNGLSVASLGNFSFAWPTRITATTRLGEGEVIDIQREIELGGAIHSKGVLTLSSFLAARFAANQPLSLSASITFEQTYSEVEGDSASLAELCALLSSLAGAPIRQCLAVTGSVDQHGRVQAIGAVNEKIEGFFDICRERGLTGDQGVLIPACNVKHLMLRRDVVEAAAAGKFHVYPVDTVDEAIELLTGIAAGMPDEKGELPHDSINYRVALRLMELSQLRRMYSAPVKERREQAGARRTPRRGRTGDANDRMG